MSQSQSTLTASPMAIFPIAPTLEGRNDQTRTQMNGLNEKSVWRNGQIYRLCSTPFRADLAYDAEPERSHRSTLYGPDGTVVSASPAHFLSDRAFVRRVSAQLYAQLHAPGSSDNDSAIDELTCLQTCEFVEGTIINLFYDPLIEEWDFMTKRKVGADTWFTRTEFTSFLGADPVSGHGFVYAPQHTFAHMFMDAMGGLDKYHLFLRDCDPKKTYTFIVQHSAAPRTAAPGPAKAYLISTQRPRVDATTGEQIIEAVSFMSPDSTIGMIVKAHPQIHVPLFYGIAAESVDLIAELAGRQSTEQITLENVEEVVAKIVQVETEYIQILGLNCILSDATGEAQTVLVADSYARLAELRGNDPNLAYTCLRLMRDEAKRDEFLEAFPWFRNMYAWVESVHSLYVRYLYDSYVEHFIYRERKGKQYSPTLYYHMKQLHQQYIQAKSVRKRMSITFVVVKEYTSKLPLSSLYASMFKEEMETSDGGNA